MEKKKENSNAVDVKKELKKCLKRPKDKQGRQKSFNSPAPSFL